MEVEGQLVRADSYFPQSVWVIELGSSRLAASLFLPSSPRFQHLKTLRVCIWLALDFRGKQSSTLHLGGCGLGGGGVGGLPAGHAGKSFVYEGGLLTAEGNSSILACLESCIPAFRGYETCMWGTPPHVS